MALCKLWLPLICKGEEKIADVLTTSLVQFIKYEIVFIIKDELTAGLAAKPIYSQTKFSARLSDMMEPT